MKHSDDAWPSRERCGWCKEYSAVGFYVPDEVWRQVVPARFGQTVSCIRCFARMADERLIEWDRDIEFYPVSLSTHLQMARGIVVESELREQIASLADTIARVPGADAHTVAASIRRREDEI